MMYNGVFFQGKRYDTETLNTLSTKELLDIYNRLTFGKGGKPVSRFESHAKALIRTWNALQAYAAEVADATCGAAGDIPHDALPGATAELKGKKKAATKIDDLLSILREHPDGVAVDTLGVMLGCDVKRVRGLIDGARTHRGKGCIVRGDAKATFRIGQE